MIRVYAKKNQLSVRESEPLTSGSVNVYRVSFGFSEDWAGLVKTAIFRAGDQSREVLLDGTATCSIPWEALREPGRQLQVGVYGTDGKAVVLPTVWAYAGTVLEGTKPGEAASQPPSPDVYDQLAGQLAGKADNLSYTESGALGLYAGQRLLSAVPVAGGEGGATDHRVLTHRDAPAQHPMEAIVGLREAVDSIPAPTERITNSELEELLK